MEQTGVLDVENPIHMFTLQYVYLARINNALSEWIVSFNDHPIQTEHNWSPNQMWLNRMIHPCNPLVNDINDVESEDMTFYREDPEAPIPTEESNNNVEVFPAQLPSNNTDELMAYLSAAVDPLQESSSFGVDIGDFTNQNATQPETSPEVICSQSASPRMLGTNLQRVFFTFRTRGWHLQRFQKT